MNCEIIAVGTELLLGQIVDTNSSWMGEQLAAAGINSHYQTKVGDNWDRISQALRLAASRSDAVIVCGGLGPTHDDITREVLAEVMGVELVLDPKLEQRIREMFAARGREMPENNLRQAMVPNGAIPIKEQPGTAPGLVAELPRLGAENGSARSGGANTAAGNVVVYLVPGVPREMKAMVAGTVIGDLRQRSGHTDVIASRTIRTWGESESGLAELLSDRIAELDQAAKNQTLRSQTASPTLAFLASGMEGIRVRISAKAASQSEAEALLEAETQTLCEILGPLVFSTADESIEQVVLQGLEQTGLTLALAESFTGGLMADRLTQAQAQNSVEASLSKGSNFKAGIVLNRPELPAEFGADRDWMNGTRPGTVEHTASGLASFVRLMFGANWGLATAHHDGENEAAFAIAGAGGTRIETVKLPPDPQLGRQWTTITAFNTLRQMLDGFKR